MPARCAAPDEHDRLSTLVHKLLGAKGTLSGITPGTRVGFFPNSDARCIVRRNSRGGGISAIAGLAVRPDRSRYAATLWVTRK